MRVVRGAGVLLALAFALASSFGGALPAQESILLRYHPSARAMVRTVVSTDFDAKLEMSGFVNFLASIGEGMAEALGGDTAEVSIRDSLEAAAAAELGGDSAGIRMELRYQLSEQVLEAASGRYVVRRTADSVRARTRAEGERWQAASPGEYPFTAAELVLDDRLRVSEFRLTTDPSAGRKLEGALRAARGGFAIELPEEPVSPGMTWITAAAFPFDPSGGMNLGGPPALGEGGDLAARTWVTLDSLVDRGTDTLAYLNLRGRFERFAGPNEGDQVEDTGSVEGTFGGTLVWSTAWNAFVLGSTRALLTVEMRFVPPGGEGGEPIGMGMRLDITNRFQVRL